MKRGAFMLQRALIVAALLMATTVAHAQTDNPQLAAFNDINPISLLESASKALPTVPNPDGSVPANPLSTSLNIVLLLTVLSLAPALLVMCTCFTRIIIVLGLLRQALGTQNLPPGQVITYGHLAMASGHPSAARAVGTAVGQNPVAYLIPCHRVIRETGVIGNYRWGQLRKRTMVAWESALSRSR